MTLNPAGFQIVADFGIPQAITGQVSTAQAAVSGGQFVFAGSQSAPVSSGASTFVTSDILVSSPASGVNYALGVATHNAVSGNYVTVLTKGIIIATADGSISPGDILTAAGGNHAVTALGSDANPVVVMRKAIGRALTSAGSEEYCLVKLDL